MSKRVIKQLSDMQIDEISLVDRGANQHALISIAKRYDVDAAFAKARSGVTNPTNTGDDKACLDEYSGDDPAGVVDDCAETAMNGGGDTGAPSGRSISGTQKVKGEDITGKAGKASTRKVSRTTHNSDQTDDEEVQEHSGSNFNLPEGLKESTGDKVRKSLLDPTDAEYELAKRLGLYLDEDFDEVDKGFGPPQPSPYQQNQQAPQFGSPPMMQSVGAQPMGMGMPQQPPTVNPNNPGMPSGGPQVPGPTATPAMPIPPMGMGSMLGQVGTPPQLNIAQLPPEVTQYIQQLEKKVAELQGQNSDSGADGTDSSDSSNSSSNSDASNKPFGKSGAFNMEQDAFYEELSKAIRDEDGRAEFSKALQARFAAYEEQVSKAEEIAKAERDLRLEREFIAKAAEFELPVSADELGPVLKRAYEGLSEEDFAVIVKCLDAATGAQQELFGEVGKRGAGANHDIFDAVQAEAEELRKNFDLTAEQAAAAIFEANPAAYDEYRRSLPGFRG